MSNFYYVLHGQKKPFDPETAIVYEDNHVLVVRKPPGLLSQGDQSKDPDLLSIYMQWIKMRDHKPGQVWLAPVHRLDRMVGGLILLAKTSKAAARLNAEMRSQRILKRYLAVLRGALEEPHGELIHYLSSETQNGRYQIMRGPEEGRYANLSYRCLAYRHEEDLSLVLITLKTGRPHQIRLQFAAEGHPLLHDRRYGEKDTADPLALAPALFACQLGVKHPTRELCLNLMVLPEGLPDFELFCTAECGLL